MAAPQLTIRGRAGAGTFHKLRKAGIVIETIRESHGGPFARRTRALCAAKLGYRPRNGRRHVVIAIAGPQIVAGGVSAPLALTPPSNPANNDEQGSGHRGG